MDAKRTGSFIAEMRKQNNMTQAELAAKLQVLPLAVSAAGAVLILVSLLIYRWRK